MIVRKHDSEVLVVVWVINVFVFFFLSGSTKRFRIFLHHLAVCIDLLICLVSRFLLSSSSVYSRSLVVLLCFTWTHIVNWLQNDLRAVLAQLNTLTGNGVVFSSFWLDLHCFQLLSLQFVFFLCDFDRFKNALDGESQQCKR